MAKRSRGSKEAAPDGEPAAADAEAALDPSAGPPSVDLSLHVPRGPLWQPAELPARWLAFSDLHVSHRTRATCMAVLEAVHEAAAARGAGILFLGDFWHTRGTLPVEPLNEVVRQLAGWRQPTLMLPGNHDQVSLGGEVHALTPLAAANPAIHAFDGPTLFLDALWLPYRRDRARLEAALAAAATAADAEGAALAAGAGAGSQALRAVFAHTDIIGALMNEAYQAHDGLPPELFPADIPTYTGHYHKPHMVPGSRITYLGSPYQVTRAEAGQQKRLLLLDRTAGWEVADELPLDLGPRYFVAAAAPAVAPAVHSLAAAEAGEQAASAASIADEAAAGGEPGSEGEADAGPEATAAGAAARPAGDEFELQLPEGLRPGDRLLLTLPPAAAKQHQKRIRKLEKQGIEVEVFTPPEARAAPRLGGAEGLGPLQLWERYCSWQRLPEAAAAAGAELLRGLLAGGSGLGEGLEQRHTSIEFHAVEVEGYFSFREPVRYDLAQRGLVVVTGQVQDTAEAGVESNGAGKTALMMAPLWALTGSVDSRAEGSNTARPVLADIINDESRRARVRVEGAVNGAPFVVERTASKKSSSVTFELDGEDLTTQENRLTQERIDAMLGADLLGRAVFYGQSDITALLEASDRSFKQELSKLVDLEVWARAKEASRLQLGSRRDELKEAGATLRERQQQAAALQQQLQGLQLEAAEWDGRHVAAAAALQEEAGQLLARLGGQQATAGAALALGQRAAADLAAEMEQVQRQLAELQQAQQALQALQQTAQQQNALGAAERALAERQQAASELRAEQQRWQFELGAAAAAAEGALEQQKAVREQAAGAAAALSAFLQQHKQLRGEHGAAEGLAAAAGQLDQLLQEQLQLRRQLEEAQQRLTAARVEAAGQQSLLGAKREQAQRAQREAAAARAALQHLLAELSAAAGGGNQQGAAERAVPLNLAEAQRRQKSVQRRLAAAQRQLGAAQGQAQERRQQLEAYLQLSGSGGGTNGGGGGPNSSSPPPADHQRAGAAVCDRCQQPISEELFLQSVQRLESEAAEVEAVASKAERQVQDLQQEADLADAAVAAAERREEQEAAVATAEQAAVARESSSAAAAAEAEQAEQAASELAAAEVAAERAVAEHQAAERQLGAALDAAQAAVQLASQRQQLDSAAAAAAAAEVEAAERLRSAEAQRADAQSALGRLDLAAADAAAAVAAAERQVQEAAAQAGEADRLEQQAALLRARREQGQQRQRTLSGLLSTLSELSSASLAAAAALEQVCGGGTGDPSTSSGSLGAGPQPPDTAAAAAAVHDPVATLEAAVEAARACQAAAAELQQRWAWHQQQPNLPARDVALVLQQLEAASQQLERVEAQQALLETEAALWKQVDDAFLPRGVVNFVVEGVLGDLQAAASRNLSALTSNMSLTLSPCKPTKRKDGDGVIEQIEKVVHVRLPGSLELRQRSVRQLSGGERRRVALALALGFSELAAQRGRLRSNLVVLDEVMQHLDGEGCLRVAQLLKQLPYDSVLVVAQAHSLLTQAVDATDVVVKAGGRSIVEQGSTTAVS